MTEVHERIVAACQALADKYPQYAALYWLAPYAIEAALCWLLLLWPWLRGVRCITRRCGGCSELQHGRIEQGRLRDPDGRYYRPTYNAETGEISGWRIDDTPPPQPNGPRIIRGTAR